MATNWTDEQKDEIVKKYQDAEPTPENSMEIVKDIAEELGHSPNAVRMILSQKQVYVKKEAGAKTATKTTSGSTGDKPARVSKEAAHADLKAAIEAAGGTVDDEIVSKLTGKAAVYFTEVLKAGATED